MLVIILRYVRLNIKTNILLLTVY